MRVVKAVVFTSALAATLPTLGHSQAYATDRGSLILGGDAGLARSTVTSSNQEDQTTTFAYLSPSVQYFVRPGLAIGGSLNLAHASQNSSSNTSYGVGPAISYFFGHGERSFYPYLSNSLFYGRSAGSDVGTLGYGASGGAVFMLSTSIGLNGSLFYRAQKITGTADPVPNFSTVGVSFGFSAFTF